MIVIRMIQRLTADRMDVPVACLRSRSKEWSTVFPRQVATYLCRKLTGMPLAEIGLAFGGQHWATVAHSVSKIEQIVKIGRNKYLLDVIRDVEESINSHYECRRYSEEEIKAHMPATLSPLP